MSNLILIDMENTLLNSNRELSTYTINVISKIAKNHKICLVTSSSLDYVIKYYNQLNLNSYIACETGGYIINPSNSESQIHTNKLSENQIKHLFLKLNHLLITMLYTSDNSAFIYKHDKKFNFLIEQYDQYEKITGAYDKLEIKPASHIIAIINPANKVEFEKYFIAANIDLENLGSDLNYILYKISHPNASKENALKFLKKLYKPNKTLSFGDSIVDFNMLMASDVGYLMANSYLARTTTDFKITAYTNDEDGVAKTLDELFSVNKI